MTEKLLELKLPIEEELIDYKVNNTICEAENVALNNIVQTMKPVEIG